MIGHAWRFFGPPVSEASPATYFVADWQDPTMVATPLIESERLPRRPVEIVGDPYLRVHADVEASVLFDLAARTERVSPWEAAVQTFNKISEGAANVA